MTDNSEQRPDLPGATEMAESLMVHWEEGMPEIAITRRMWLTMQALRYETTDWELAREAVASVAIEHPEWDMDELKTWSEWKKAE